MVSLAFSNCQPYSKEKMVRLGSGVVAVLSGPVLALLAVEAQWESVNYHGKISASGTPKIEQSAIDFCSWTTIHYLSIEFGGSFTEVRKVETGPVWLQGMYLASHHCNNADILWLTFIKSVTWESCRVKASILFFLIHFEFSFYYNTRHDEVTGLCFLIY